MDTCGMSMIKYLLFAFNLIFALSGLAILLAGTVVLVDFGDFSHFLDGKLISTPIILMIAGVMVFIVAFLGCYGAIKEKYSMLIAFAAILAIIFVIELTVGITAAVYRGDVSTVLKNALKKSMKLYDSSQTDKSAWDDVQKKFSCCGVEKSEDWRESGVISIGAYPDSCCENPIFGQCIPAAERKGCFAILEEKIKSNANVVIIFGIGIAFIEIAGIVLAGCLAMAIKKEGEK